MPSAGLYHRLKAEIDRIPVVDMHEHLVLPEEDYLEMAATRGADFGRFFQAVDVAERLLGGNARSIFSLE